MLGWLDLPYTYDKEEFARIKAAAKRIQEQSQVLVVIGIGGSYLGARAGLERRYGESRAQERIYATTDKAKGALRGMTEQKGYETFVVPDNIGGRFSCLSAVGLLPMAAGGMDIDRVMEGCLHSCEVYKNPDFLAMTLHRALAGTNR